MTPETALGDALARRLLGIALDRLDRSRPEQRKNAIRISIDQITAPEIFKAETIADRDVAWHALDVLAEAGIGTVVYRRAARHGSREDREPVFELSAAEGNEDRLRTFYGRPRPGQKYSEEWRSLVQGSDLDNDIKSAISELPVSIAGRSAAEVFERLISVRTLYYAQENVYLREVSSRTFWGLSKVLDSRSELIAALLGLAECPYPPQPIHLNVYFAGSFSWILFVENKTSFERAVRDANDAFVQGRHTPYGGAALIYSGGFMGAAGRMRKTSGSRTFYCLDTVSTARQVEDFEAAFYSDRDISAAFWGDLDPAGMAILSSLRTTFPSVKAWEPGYAPMLIRLDAGEGHAPEEARKVGQKPVLSTGCRYADDVLIPALQKYGRFIDQE
ncbi:Wadjet anti-phage system protein JetD domain-containing protein [Bradyrhizobium sp. UFLA05-153]